MTYQLALTILSFSNFTASMKKSIKNPLAKPWSNERVIERLTSFGIPFIKEADLEYLREDWNHYTTNRRRIKVKALLFKFPNETGITFFANRTWRTCAYTEPFRPEAGPTLDGRSITTYNKRLYSTLASCDVGGVHLSVTFNNLLLRPEITISSTCQDEYSNGNVCFDLRTNHKELEIVAYQFCQHTYPGYVFLDMLREKIPYISGLI